VAVSCSQILVMKQKATLAENGLVQICISTVYRWLKKLGFGYEPR
jgi:hypothetical protein